jgi:hypothetical protein
MLFDAPPGWLIFDGAEWDVFGAAEWLWAAGLAGAEDFGGGGDEVFLLF